MSYQLFSTLLVSGAVLPYERRVFGLARTCVCVCGGGFGGSGLRTSVHLSRHMICVEIHDQLPHLLLHLHRWESSSAQEGNPSSENHQCLFCPFSSAQVGNLARENHNHLL